VDNHKREGGMTEQELQAIEKRANGATLCVSCADPEGFACGVCQGVLNERALVAEVRKLWGIVHSAWEEAYDAGQRSVRETENVPVVWLSSKTRAALGDGP
jgi:hypothetical protein